ncbi:hypothetical protein AEAC466_11620 [Asticcacaulis sp. AC466]|uniref:DUF983 domain-containing protein n=1 Tax=Asticcacaulis sp. AC466 TaxID=1282362 RepID=UPI0003C3EA34|nr:DUF983 domain-containing protein [Asticcacaulis sp. AC466]ESQ83809.1 hypothetical protein AEAC466_11620 [Asticcacaulis sp. AC466]
MTLPTGGKVNFLAAASGKCPVCGQGRLFKSYLKAADSCAACGQDFKAADTGDGPVVFVILIAGFIACGGLLTTFFLYPDWSPMIHLMIWPAVAVIVSLLLMQPLKALMIASQLRNKVRD